jgi:hypothetical protein
MAEKKPKAIRKGRRRRVKRLKRKSPATIYFNTAENEEGHMQTCVYAECHLSVVKVGPVWGHSDRSIKRALGELTEVCDCPGQFHNAKYREGYQVLPKKTS